MASRRGKGGFFFLGSKITVDGNCSHKIKRSLLLGRKVMTNLHSVLKSKDTTLPTKAKVHLVKGPSSHSYGFSSGHVRMWELDHKEGWVPKNWCFWTVMRSSRRSSGRPLRIPWTARRSNQSILKEISPEYSLEGLMLKLQYFGHLIRKADSLEKALMLAKIEGKRRGQ